MSMDERAASEKCSPIAVVAAMRIECDAIAARLRASNGDSRAVVCVTGIGAQRAVAAVDDLIRLHSPSVLLHVGFAGGLDPALTEGDVVRVGRVINEAGERITLDPAEGRGVLLTVDDVADSPAAKARLFKQHLAAAVDMETWYVARRAQAAGIRMIALRAISDAADMTLPAACVNWLTPEGESKPVAAAMYALTRPWRIPTLMGVARGVGLAGRRLTAETLRIIDDELR